MYKPWGITQIYTHSRRSNGEIPKSLICFFLTAQLLGIDLGFTMVLKKKLRYVVQYLSYFLAVTFVLILLAPAFNLFKEFWFWLNFSEYLIYATALRTTKYNAYNFIVEINEIYDLKIAEKKNFKGIAITNILAIITMQAIFATAFCISNKDVFEEQFYTSFYYILYCVPSLGIHLILIAKLIIIYYIYCCIKDLKERFLSSRISLEKAGKRYTEIADVYDKIRPFYDIITVVQIVIGVPKMMSTLWYFLLFMQTNADWFWSTNELLLTFHIATTICLPCIVAEMVKAQMDSLTLSLHCLVMEEKDGLKISEILQFLRYLKARNLQYKTWRIIPVDVQLLLALFSVCTTYFIVLIQFTHLYG